MDDTALAKQPPIQWCARKCRHKGDLNLVKDGVSYKLKDIFEHFGRVAIQAEDEATVNGNAEGLDPGDSCAIGILLAQLPIALQLKSIEASRARRFQTNQDLLT